MKLTASPTMHRRSPRRAAVITGAALLAMAILAGTAVGVLEWLYVNDDQAATIGNFTDSPGWFWYSAMALAVVVILDLIVAAGLYVFFRPADPRIATVVALARVIYAVIFAAAIAGLWRVLPLLDDLDAHGGSAVGRIEDFYRVWDIALLVFGVHLLILGALIWTATYTPRWLGALVVLAGAGYVIDSVGALWISGDTLDLAMFTFVGEVALFVWLLWKGRRVSAREITQRTR